VDPSRAAAVGHSVGGVESILIAMRNHNVSAVAGLDGTYGFKGFSDVLTKEASYSADGFRGALLDIRRAQGVGAADLDNSVLEALRFSDRMQVTVPQIQHEDFTSRAEAGALAFQGKDMSPVVQNGKSGYEFVCEFLGTFLAHQFESAGDARYDMEALAKTVDGGYRHWGAETPPQTAWQQWVAVLPKGPEAIKAQLREQCDSEQLDTCIAVEALRAAGSDLAARGQFQDALMVGQVVAWARPRSVFVQDALANAYKAVGDREEYRKALERSIELIPVDRTLMPETEPSFVQMQRDKLERLPP